MATFKLCSRLRSESKVLKRPSLNGFSVYDMVEPEANSPTIENINGKPYNVHIIRKTQLFPLQAGTFEIDPVELDNKVKFIKLGDAGTGSRSPLQKLIDEFVNDGIGGRVEEQTFTLASKPVTIRVKPLPVASKPESFNGAVGKFSMHVEVKDRTIAAGEAIDLKLLIKGKGNFTVINPPFVQVPAGMEGYDPQITENIDKFIYPLSGSKIFNYTIIARDTGTFTIPSVAFSYFDPVDEHYKTELSDSFRVSVTSFNKAIAPRKSRFARDPSPDQSPWIDHIPINVLVLIIAILVFAGIGLYLWKKNRKDMKGAESALPVKTDFAVKTIESDLEPLEEARWALKEGNSNLFYTELNKAIWKKISEKIYIPSTELNKYNAVLRLRQEGLNNTLIHHLESVLNECEIALYTPVHSASDMQQTFIKAKALIKALDEELA